MKYCLSSLCKDNILSQVDEIKFLWKNRRAIPDFIEKYPNATIILHKTVDTDASEWDDLKMFNTLAQGRFIVAVNSVDEMELAKSFGIKFYWGYPITSFFELNAIAEMGVEYIRLGMPLFFELDKVKEITDIPIRAVPNIAYNDGLPRLNGAFGQWIRPEDLETTYADYISAVEFEGVHTEQEEFLYEVYHTRRRWKFELEHIIVNLNMSGKNKMLPENIGEMRLNCGQRCQSKPNVCQFCYRALQMANVERVEEYINEVMPERMPTEEEFENWEEEHYPTHKNL